MHALDPKIPAAGTEGSSNRIPERPTAQFQARSEKIGKTLKYGTMAEARLSEDQGTPQLLQLSSEQQVEHMRYGRSGSASSFEISLLPHHGYWPWKTAISKLVGSRS